MSRFKVNVRMSIPEETITCFYRQNHIQRLALFSSVLRDDVGPDSDVDGQAASEKLRVAFSCSKTGRSCIMPLTMKWPDHITVDPQVRYD